MSLTVKSAASLLPGDTVTQNYGVVDGGVVKLGSRVVSITAVREDLIRYRGEYVPVLHVVGIDPARTVDPRKPEKVGWVRWIATPASKVAVLG
jgi:hypothetical protein